jgi:hypothetical protein
MRLNVILFRLEDAPAAYWACKANAQGGEVGATYSQAEYVEHLADIENT